MESLIPLATFVKENNMLDVTDIAFLIGVMDKSTIQGLEANHKMVEVFLKLSQAKTTLMKVAENTANAKIVSDACIEAKVRNGFVPKLIAVDKVSENE